MIDVFLLLQVSHSVLFCVIDRKNAHSELLALSRERRLKSYREKWNSVYCR